jgi:hypothetical protein
MKGESTQMLLHTKDSTTRLLIDVKFKGYLAGNDCSLNENDEGEIMAYLDGIASLSDNNSTDTVRMTGKVLNNKSGDFKCSVTGKKAARLLEVVIPVEQTDHINTLLNQCEYSKEVHALLIDYPSLFSWYTFSQFDHFIKTIHAFEVAILSNNDHAKIEDYLVYDKQNYIRLNLTLSTQHVEKMKREIDHSSHQWNEDKLIAFMVQFCNLSNERDIAFGDYFNA